MTLSSSRYPESINPGVFKHVTPCLNASPLRGWTKPAYPEGISIAIPVGINALPPAGASRAPRAA